MNLKRLMTQTATYWGPGTDDGLGGVTFPSPFLIDVRWQEKAELFRDSQGNQVVSNAVVYPPEPLAVGGYLALGNSTGEPDPRNVGGAYEVRNVAFSPSLDGSIKLNKAML